jgi:Cu(I)/Ag(I) efflux system protein CusF
MKRMQPRPASILLLAMTLVLAATPARSAPATAPAATAAVPKEFTAGEVRNLDKAARTITLKHGEIKNLGMPPMAMVFEVKDAKLLDKFKAGDKVRFKAVHDAGKYVVVDLQAAK